AFRRRYRDQPGANREASRTCKGGFEGRGNGSSAHLELGGSEKLHLQPRRSGAAAPPVSAPKKQSQAQAHRPLQNRRRSTRS
ncbi:unnamed protein product, partial [Amoebophrya sp. A120]